MVARFLVLTEDSGREAQATIHVLVKAGVSLVSPTTDSRQVLLRPPPENDALVKALRANGWKTRKPTPEKTRLLGEIANSLHDGFVIFHVDSDTKWAARGASENRASFDAIIRSGVSSVLQGFAPNPIGRNAPKLTEGEATHALKRLFVMQPCYSIESWLYQSSVTLEFCAEVHADAEHQMKIGSWLLNRTLLDEVLRPKDEALGECVRDRHNLELAAAFPSAQVHAARKSWTEFVDQLAGSSDLLEQLAS